MNENASAAADHASGVPSPERGSLQRHGSYALVLMANNYHMGGLDKHGNLPHSMRDLNSFVARILNSMYGRDDKFWSDDGYHIVRPVNPKDVWARLMYITSIPLNADLVARTQGYPGFVVPECFGLSHDEYAGAGVRTDAGAHGGPG